MHLLLRRTLVHYENYQPLNSLLLEKEIVYFVIINKSFMKSFYSFLLLSISLFRFHSAFSQKNYGEEDANVYLLKKDFSPAKNESEAKYFLQLIKADDTTYVCRYYNKTGPMIRQEVFYDANLSIPNGRFCWYDENGNLDSTGFVNHGQKDQQWITYNDKMEKTKSYKYDNGREIERRDYTANLYIGKDGSTAKLDEKEKAEHDAYVADSIANKLILQEAKFDEGNDKNKKWQKYLEKNLQVPNRTMTVLGRGTYSILVSFVVNKDGSTDDIFIMQSVEWSADTEIFHLIKDSPKWIPATRNGEKVLYRQKQFISFQVN